MTPKEKAKELVEKFEELDNPTWDGEYQEWNDQPIQRDTAKFAAIICIDEIMEANHIREFGYPDTIYTVETLTGGRQFWEQVKAEIEAM